MKYLKPAPWGTFSCATQRCTCVMQTCSHVVQLSTTHCLLCVSSWGAVCARVAVRPHAVHPKIMCAGGPALAIWKQAVVFPHLVLPVNNPHEISTACVLAWSVPLVAVAVHPRFGTSCSLSDLSWSQGEADVSYWRLVDVRLPHAAPDVPRRWSLRFWHEMNSQSRVMIGAMSAQTVHVSDSKTQP